jgi:hypothetical protein
LKFQYVQRFLPTHFVHPVSSFKKDITATTVEISTVVAVFTNTFCPISRSKCTQIKNTSKIQKKTRSTNAAGERDE